jgi:glycosyltransferase involved in cell wall biosynthesis
MFNVLLDLHCEAAPLWERMPDPALALARTKDFDTLLVCRKNSPSALQAEAEKLPLLTLGSDSPFHPLSLLRLWLRLRKHRRVLLHSFGGQAAALAYLLARRRERGTALLVHSHFFRPRLRHPFFPQSCAAAAGIICGSSAIAAHVLKESGLRPGKTHVIPPGVSHREYPRRAESDGRFVVCMPAPLESGNGQDMLIRAMSALWQMDDLPPWEVRLIGSGSMFHSLLEEARELGVLDRLSVLGEQDVRETLPRCSALILPFNAMVYTPGLAAGWAVGLPVICPDHPACREIARHGENALFVRPDNPQDLAAAVLLLIREPRIARKLAEGGRASLPAVGEKRMLDDCRALYLELAAGRGWALRARANE